MTRSLEDLIRDANAALLGRGDLEAVAGHFTPDYCVHLSGRNLRGHEAVRTTIGAIRAAFTDLTVEVEVLLVGDDRIAWQRTLRGVHTERFQGFPATGRPLTWRDMATSRVADGRIAEKWVLSDLAGALLRARKQRR